MGRQDIYRGLTEHPVLAMPQPVGDALLIGISGAVAILLLRAVVRARSDKGTMLLVLICGLACSGMEAFAEFMAMNYHPEIGGHIAYRAWTMPVPVHIVLSYALYFGGPGYVMLAWIERDLSTAAWWRIAGCLAVGVFIADIAAVHYGAWIYYGRQPLVLLGVPLFWMFCNTASIFAFTAILRACLLHLVGARRLLTLAIAPVGLSMAWAGVALPIGNALHSDAEELTLVLAAFLTCGVCLLICGLAICYFRTSAGPRVLLELPERQ